MPSLSRRLREMPLLRGIVTRLVAFWLRRCRAGVRWRVEGVDAVRALAAKGPVVFVMWHEHLMMCTVHWQQHVGTPMLSVHDTSSIGRLAGELQPLFGSTPMAMSSKTSNLAISRAVMRQARAGVTVGITGDGPNGPVRVLNDAPLDWARITGLPVVVYAWDTARARRLKTWDRLMVPLPFGRGACVFAVASTGLSRDDTAGDHRPAIEAALGAVTARAAALLDR